MKLVDIGDSKSPVRKNVAVRVRPLVPTPFVSPSLPRFRVIPWKSDSSVTICALVVIQLSVVEGIADIDSKSLVQFSMAVPDPKRS